MGSLFSLLEVALMASVFPSQSLVREPTWGVCPIVHSGTEEMTRGPTRPTVSQTWLKLHGSSDLPMLLLSLEGHSDWRGQDLLESLLIQN